MSEGDELRETSEEESVSTPKSRGYFGNPQDKIMEGVEAPPLINVDVELNVTPHTYKFHGQTH